MTRMPLSADWTMASATMVAGRDVHSADMPAAGWLPVRVPTTVQAAHVAAGAAPDPWVDRQADALRPHNEESWWFRTTFAVPPADRDADRYEIVCEGVLLFATIWLNGAPVGFSSNAHHAHRFDVTTHVRRDGENVLAIECGLNLKEMRKRARPELRPTGETHRALMRMPQFCFGWDISPRIELVGPWRPVSFLAHHGATIDDAYVATERIDSDGGSEIVAHADVRAWTGGGMTLRVAIRETVGGPIVREATAPVTGTGAVAIPIRLDRARLWYPQPLGEPFRYIHETTLHATDGTVLDARSDKFGVRTIAIRQDGQFTFCINGIDVFAKGANWVPADSLTLDATRERYAHLLGLARDAGMNMLRVWGGGIYESEDFYDLCDEHGIMVWQDFMYACSMYPDDDPAFMESAAREARVVAERLRRHPSLAVWCGNNECQEAWVLGDWPNYAPRHFGERLYDHVLPDTVAAVAPDVPYWPGSPYGGPTTRSREIGDFHDWYSLPNWRTYDDNAPLFSSEYGFRAAPARETFDAMFSPENRWEPHPPQHVAWQYHHGWCGWMNAIVPEFGAPKTLDEYIMLTQEAQATLMRYAIEVYRRRMFRTSGSLLWMYDEPWPSISFGVVDHHGRPKASYYWVRNAYAPVIGMIYAKDGRTSFWGISDLAAARPIEATIRRMRFDGTVLGEHTLSGELPPNASTCLIPDLPATLRIGNPAEELLRATYSSGEYAGERTFSAAARKEWRLAPARITACAERVGAGEIRVTLASDAFVHFVAATVADPAARYSDNFVDLFPGEPRSIVIRTSDRGHVTVRSANAESLTVTPE